MRHQVYRILYGEKGIQYILVNANAEDRFPKKRRKCRRLKRKEEADKIRYLRKLEILRGKIPQEFFDYLEYWIKL